MAVSVQPDSWPTWAKALLIAQLALTLAVVLPWILMWTACAGMGQMQMPGMPMMPGR